MKAKLKTKKSVAKRFKFTKKGKLKLHHAYKGHLLAKKSTKRKRKLRQAGILANKEISKIRRLLPYG